MARFHSRVTRIDDEGLRNCRRTQYSGYQAQTGRRPTGEAALLQLSHSRDMNADTLSYVAFPPAHFGKVR